MSKRRISAVSRIHGASVKTKRVHRLYMIGTVALLWSAALGYRLFSLQVSDFERWRHWAKKQHVTEVKVASERGPIIDRNGKLVAVSVPAESVFAHPKHVDDPAKTAKLLAPILNQDVAVLKKLLTSDKPFVWLARQLPRFTAEEVTNLKLSGVDTILESRRYYPYNQAASAVIGKVGVDGAGLSGLELLYEKQLNKEELSSPARRDALGNLIYPASFSSGVDFELPKGDAIRLTLDADLQTIVDEELEAGKKKANAKQAMAVMIDSDTGEILALSQAPSFNLNFPTAETKKGLKSILVETVYEPGSVMKPLVAAAGIQEKLFSPAEMINCEKGRYSYGKHTIKDVHPSGTISLHDVVVRSSNIGMTKVGDRLGPTKLFRYLQDLGFGQSTNLGLPGESKGILRNVKTWSKVDVATHSFGQGIAVTPLQIVRATASIANGGILPTLSLVQGVKASEPRRVYSEKVANLVRTMMVDVVEAEHGTGGNAKIPGVVIGGKTGTAQKASPTGRGYQAGLYVASFVGFIDARELGISQQFTLMVAIDEPHTNTIYGGTLAAPVFKKIVERSLAFIANREKLRPEVTKPQPILREEPLIQTVGYGDR